MELIAVRLTKQTIKEMDSLVKEGIYPTRSEVLREGARNLLIKHRGVKNYCFARKEV